ncbi:hypothetical protein [Flavobacterium humidisoli]|uniref:Gliding motility-associated protein GldM N-terminal domain-containing protein n=1 Tax=Flavobacterium humidisoli TaxID=2937442 RepID=A0ABY4LVJ0_9FLAO|nr:hypothetical protein [Flavobacterium humidisoli]UPZ16593.1 hypothetical protein M0M44_04460 [Flavobacterium humidisoli]
MKHLYIKLVLFLLLSLNVCCQSKNELWNEQETAKSVVLQLNEFREISNTSKEILKYTVFSKYEVLKVKYEESPKSFGEMMKFATQIYDTGNEINDYIEEIKAEISEEDCFVTNDTALYDAFVKQKYAVLKSKIDKFYKQNKVITYSGGVYASFKGDNEKLFNTNKTFINKENKSVDFLNYRFGYKANIGLLTGLEKIQFDVIHFQYMFMNTIIGSAH